MEESWWAKWRTRRRQAKQDKPQAASAPVASQGPGRLGLGRWMRSSPFVAVLAVGIFASSENLGSEATFLSATSLGLAIVAASLFGGVLLGFLFGLPRTIDRSESKGRLATNTNLDQISDWLTKILVGLGLVQIGKITHGLSQLGESLAPGLGGGSGAKPFAVALLVYSALDGFLVGYIWTRIDLSKRFRLAAEDLDPVEKATEKALQSPLPEPPEKAP